MRKILDLFKVALMTGLIGCFLSACGGGGGGGGTGGTPTPTPTPTTTLKGTVTFPAATTGKIIAKSVFATTTPTIQILDLNGNVIATPDVTAGSTADTYSYSTTATISKDVIIKAVRGNQVLRAALDSSTYASGASKDVDVVTTTAVISLEQTLGVTPGALGTSSAPATPPALKDYKPADIETNIKTALDTAVSTSATTFTSVQADFANLANIIAAALKSNIDAAQYVAGTVTTTITTTITTYTVSTAGAPVAATLAADKVKTTVDSALVNIKNNITAGVTYAGTYNGNLTDWTVNGVTRNDSGSNASMVAVIDTSGKMTFTSTKKDGTTKQYTATVTSQGAFTFTGNNNLTVNGTIKDGVITLSYSSSTTDYPGQTETGHATLTKVSASTGSVSVAW